MKKLITGLKITVVSVLFLTTINFFSVSCRPENIVEQTITDTLIFNYLKAHPENFSIYTHLLDTIGYSDFLSAYGVFTCFVPTNEAFNNYFNLVGKSSLSNFSMDELKNIANIHIIGDTLSSYRFIDGRMPVKTLYKQYLITGPGFNNSGEPVTIINKSAVITQTNMKMANGYLHVIDKVLVPVTRTLSDVTDNPEYSIFTTALKETGFYDFLNKLNILPNDEVDNYTVLGESDENYAAYNIFSYQDLLTQLKSENANPRDTTSMIYQYVAYHVLTKGRFVLDLQLENTSDNFTFRKLVTSRTVDDTIIMLNEKMKNGKFEGGVKLNRSKSDVVASNGVFHSLGISKDGKLPLIPLDEQPVPIYWEITDQPEIKSMGSVFRKSGASQIFSEPMKGLVWNPVNSSSGVLTYKCVLPTFSDGAFYYNDYLEWNGKNVTTVKIKTPFLVKGYYKVWFCGCGYRVSTTTFKISYKSWVLADDDFSIDDPSDYTALTNYYHTSSINQDPNRKYTLLNNYTMADLEAVGLKTYTINSDGTFDRTVQDSRWSPTSYKSYGYSMYGINLGVMVVEKDGYYRLKVETVQGSGNSVKLDMIHFIPTSENQQWPKFSRNGEIIPYTSAYLDPRQ